jgi:hypothetical protein
MTQLSLPVCDGRMVEATYRDPLIPGYRGNPLIETLPPILTVNETIALLQYKPDYDKRNRTLPVELRLHLIQDAMRFFKPLPVHLDLEQRFSRMIRAGYQERNPVQRGFRPAAKQRLDAFNIEGGTPNRLRPNGFTILGMSGVGKTTGVEAILSLYPQIVVHTCYQERPFTHVQLIWLKLDCPHDGSIRGLCLDFFQTIDQLLDTHYYQHYARRGRATTDELLPALARVGAAHSLGVLVIDEIQHLNGSKSGGASRMLNFFVQLVNIIGMPVVLVGTPKARAVLTGEFRQARRAAGQGDLVWDRLPADALWELFMSALWPYQYTQRPTPLTPALSHALYDESQGILDLAVKLYMLSQGRAITTGQETITEATIRSVAADSLRLAQPMLAALRSGDRQRLLCFEDIYPIDCEPRLRHLVIPAQDNEPVGEVSGGEDDGDPAAKGAKPAPVKCTPKTYQSGIVRIAAQAQDKGQTVYDALDRAGYLRPATAYLEVGT